MALLTLASPSSGATSLTRNNYPRCSNLNSFFPISKLVSTLIISPDNLYYQKMANTTTKMIMVFVGRQKDHEAYA